MDGEEFPEAPNGSSTHTLSASLKRNFDRLTANGDHAEATGSNLHNPDANASDRNGNKRLRSSSPTRAQGHGQTSLMAPSSLANVYNTSQPSTMSSSRVLDDDGSSNSTTHTSMLLDAPVSLATSFLRPRTGSETTPISTASGPAAVNGSDRSTPLQDRSSLTRDEWQITNRDTTGQNRTLTSISGPSILQSLPNASSLSGTRQGATQAQLDALETVLARSRDFQANVQAILESPVSAQGVRPPIPTRGATGDPSGTTLPRRHTTTPRWPELVPIALDSPRSVLMSSVAYESVDSSGNETDATARVQTAETSASEQPLVPNWGSRSTGPSIAAVEHPAANILHNGSAPVLPFRSHPPRRIGSPPTMDWSQVPASAETLTSAASTIDSNEASESMSRMATPPTSPRMVMPVEERRTYQNPRSAGTTNSNWRRLVPVPNSPALRSDPASVDVNAGNASDGSFSFRPQPLPGSGPTALSRGGLAHGPPIMSSGVRSGTRRSSLLRNVIETSPVPDQFRNHIRLEDGDSFHNPFPPALGPVASRSQNIPSPNRTNNDPRQLSHSSSLPQPRLPQWQRRLAPYPPQLSQRRDWLHEGPVHDRTRNWADSLWSPGGEDWDDPTGNSFPDDIADDMTTFRGVRNPGERYPQANRIPSVGDTDAVDVGLLNDLSGDSQHNSSSRPSPSWEQPVVRPGSFNSFIADSLNRQEWNPSPSLIPPRIRSDGLSTVYRRSQAISGDRRTRNTSDEVVASSFESSGVATPVFRDLVDMPGGSGPEPANAQRSHRQPPGLLRRLTHNAGLFPPFTRRADEPPEVYVIAPSASREETESLDLSSMDRMSTISEYQAFVRRIQRIRSRLHQQMNSLDGALREARNRIDTLQDSIAIPYANSSSFPRGASENPQSGLLGAPIPYPSSRQSTQNRNLGVAQQMRPETMRDSSRDVQWSPQYRHPPPPPPFRVHHARPAVGIRRRTTTVGGYDSVMGHSDREIAMNGLRGEMTSDSDEEPLIDLSDGSRERDTRADYLERHHNPPAMRSPRSSAFWEASRGGNLAPSSFRTQSPSPTAYPQISAGGGAGIGLESWTLGPRGRVNHSGRPSLSNMGNGAFGVIRRRMGDYMFDSEIDNSYEGLLRLGERIGFAGPQHTPSSIINSLRRGIFSGFPNPGNETRCPICLDDYLPDVQVLAAYPCNHFYHSECLEQWLQSSRSCPNCRTRIQPPRSPTTAFTRTENSIPSAPLNTNSLEQPVAHGGAPGGLREAMTSAETQTESMLGIENRVEEM